MHGYFFLKRKKTPLINSITNGYDMNNVFRLIKVLYLRQENGVVVPELCSTSLL